jgi:hypothetical protein
MVILCPNETPESESQVNGEVTLLAAANPDD